VIDVKCLDVVVETTHIFKVRSNQITIKLVYNKLGYKKLQLKTNNSIPFFQSQIHGYSLIEHRRLSCITWVTTLTDPVIANSSYKKQIYLVPKCSLKSSLTVLFLVAI
jgi:hypothetical protein